MTEHNVITDPYLHEPKGASTADEDSGYFSNGAGSGSWRKIYTSGWEDFNDSGVAQPLTSTAWVDITNDGAGANSNSAYRLPGTSAIWDVANNELNFAAAGLSIGDTVDIRFDYDVVVNTANDVVKMAMDMAHGSASEFKLLLDSRNFDTAGTHNVSRFTSVYIGSAAVLNNPTKISMYADSAGDSVIMNGFYIRVVPINPVIV